MQEVWDPPYEMGESYLGAAAGFGRLGASADAFTQAINDFGNILGSIADVVTEEDEVEEAMTDNPLWGSF